MGVDYIGSPAGRSPNGCGLYWVSRWKLCGKNVSAMEVLSTYIVTLLTFLGATKVMSSYVSSLVKISNASKVCGVFNTISTFMMSR